MNLKRQTLVLALAVITALCITVSIVSSHNLPDKHSSSFSDDHERTIIGVWRMALTTDLPESKARVWRRDLQTARRRLKAPADKWRQFSTPTSSS